MLALCRVGRVRALTHTLWTKRSKRIAQCKRKPVHEAETLAALFVAYAILVVVCVVRSATCLCCFVYTLFSSLAAVRSVWRCVWIGFERTNKSKKKKYTRRTKRCEVVEIRCMLWFTIANSLQVNIVSNTSYEKRVRVSATRIFFIYSISIFSVVFFLYFVCLFYNLKIKRRKKKKIAWK